MKSLYRVISVSCLIIGSVVGAGFASGREVLLFFKNSNAFFVATTIFIFFAMCGCLLLSNAKSYDTDDVNIVNSKLLKNHSSILNLLLVVASFIFLCAMSSGGGYIISMVFNDTNLNVVGGLITSVICIMILYGGLKIIKLVNIVCVTLLIVFIIIATRNNSGNNTNVILEVPVGQALMYVMLNAVTLYAVLIKVGQRMSKGEIIASSLISAFILATLIYLILRFLGNDDNGVMPIIDRVVAVSYQLYIFGIIVVYLAIITTLVSCAYPVAGYLTEITNNKFFSICIAIFSSFAVGLVGFDNIVDTMYPIISIIGLVFVGLSVFRQIEKI